MDNGAVGKRKFRQPHHVEKKENIIHMQLVFFHLVR